MNHAQALALSQTPHQDKPTTFSGNKGLQLEEPLLFEHDTPGLSGADWPEVSLTTSYLNNLQRTHIGLPGLSEPQVVRHFTRLSQKNYSIDAGLYPLGSCTMKHNPRLNEKVARLFTDLHPLQPLSTLQGALEVIDRLAHWLKVLTGLPSLALSPAAGAHGELCGIMTIKAAIEARGESRPLILVAESAHGTNPATAAACGFTVKSIPGLANGRVDTAALKAALTPEVAAVMITNPNTCGLFENEILEMANAIHHQGAFLYCDGANFNAIVGKVRPVDLGIDCMHFNLHKTFSTPNGGGGPGSGPVALSAELAPFAPLPFVVHGPQGYEVKEHSHEAPQSIGRLKGFHGQMGMFTRALAYMMSHGADGLMQVAEDAVLNANYILARLKSHLSAPFEGPCMHEALFDDHFLKGSDVTTLDLAKVLIDEGFHPMTMYFPLVVSGALLIEPTETESKESIDGFCDVLIDCAVAIQRGETERFKGAPLHAPRQRLDETLAARQPILRYKKPHE